MAGQGPAPKDPSRRARRDPRDKSIRTFEVKACPQPSLPKSRNWHPQTIEWWKTWKTAPQAKDFVATDWSFLIDTALMHDAMWSKGQWTLAAEVRLRVAKVGATPEDRARLKMIFAFANEKAPARKPSTAAKRYGKLKVVPDVPTAAQA